MDTSVNDETIVVLRSYNKQKLAVYLILASILFQNTAYLILDSALDEILHDNRTLNWTDHNSFIVLYVFKGTEFFLMLLFAIVSDAKVKRAKLIAIGLPIYLIGFILMLIISKNSSLICFNNGSTYDDRQIDEEQCHITVLISVLLISIGSAAVRSNVIILGIEQIQPLDLTARYGDKMVIIVNISAIIEILAETVLLNAHSYFKLFLLANSMLVVSIFFFFIGWRVYNHVEPYDSALLNCIPVLSNAFRIWYEYKKNKNNVVNEEFQTLNQTVTFLDFAKVTNNGKFQDRFVDDVKLLRNAFIIFLLLIPYRIIYSQVYSSFQTQAKYMAHTQGDEMISLSQPLAVITGVIIFNIIVYKYRDVRNRLFTIGNKFIISMIFALFTMFIVSGVEVARQYGCDGAENNVSNLTIYFQLPQNLGLGFAQSLASLASYEFAFFLAPRSARSFFMTLYLFSIVAASLIRRGYTHMFSDQLLFNCLTNGYNWSYLYFFLILTGIHFVFTIIFVISEKRTRLLKLDPDQFENNPIRRSSM